MQILNCHNAIGKTHDYQMIKDSKILPILEEMKIGSCFDSGYQVIQKELTNTVIPFKKSKNHELCEEEKEYNKELSKQRIKIEHVNTQIKIFRSMKVGYRNRMNWHDEKLTIMCRIYNFNHEL